MTQGLGAARAVPVSSPHWTIPAYFGSEDSAAKTSRARTNSPPPAPHKPGTVSGLLTSPWAKVSSA